MVIAGFMEATYYSLMGSIERSYRLFLDTIKKRLDKIPVYDINNIQALMIYNIGDQEISVGELTTRGIYQGSNVSYNLKKLIQLGYVVQKPSTHDRRSFYIRLSDKGRQMLQVIKTCIDEQDSEIVKFFNNKKNFLRVAENIVQLESFLLQQSVRGC